MTRRRTTTTRGPNFRRANTKRNEHQTKFPAPVRRQYVPLYAFQPILACVTSGIVPRINPGSNTSKSLFSSASRYAPVPTAGSNTAAAVAASSLYERASGWRSKASEAELKGVAVCRD